MFLTDFHLHSTFSDGKLTIPELVDFFGQRGFGAIAITDHVCDTHTLIGKTAHWIGQTLTKENFPEYIHIIKEEAQRAWDQYGMLVIPGYELSKNYISNRRSAHILALGLTEFISADQDALSMIREIKSNGGFSIAAHPVSTRRAEKQTLHLWDRRQELSNEMDAWEVASGTYMFDEVLMSGLPMVANSDMHRPSQMTSWKTVFTCEKKIDAIFEAIREQDLDFYYYEDKVPVQVAQARSSFSAFGNLQINSAP